MPAASSAVPRRTVLKALAAAPILAAGLPAIARVRRDRAETTEPSHSNTTYSHQHLIGVL
jgi:hypothetical protein